MIGDGGGLAFSGLEVETRLKVVLEPVSISEGWDCSNCPYTELAKLPKNTQHQHSFFRLQNNKQSWSARRLTTLLSSTSDRMNCAACVLNK